MTDSETIAIHREGRTLLGQLNASQVLSLGYRMGMSKRDELREQENKALTKRR